LSRLVDTSTIGILALNHPSSGGIISNAQQQINTNVSNIATNAANIASNDTDIATLFSITTFNNFSATSDPGPTADTNSGYGVGSIWVNTTDDKIFMAVDVTASAAIWKRLDKPMFEIDQTYFNSSLAVTDAAWVELIADTGSNVIRKIQSFYGAGSAAEIGIGAAASEVELYILPAGGQDVEVNIPANSRISIRLKSGETALTASTIALNLFKES
jgi:hypothetical protein